MIDVELRSALPLFRETRRETATALAKRGVEVRFPANAVLFLTGSRPRGWWIVIEGTVRVVRGSGARQHVIHTEQRAGSR